MSSLSLLAILLLGQAAPLPTVPPNKRVAPVAAIKGREAPRLRILVVVDTDDRLGVTWGRDGDNVKAVLDSAIKKQQLGDRVTVDVFTGKQVTPERVLAHYRELAAGPGEALVFYYSGHGGLHYTKGHYLALTHGRLYRSDILAAMAARKPQLAVLLTDCCANWYGGALHAEPATVKIERNANKTVAYKQTPVRRMAPPGEMLVAVTLKPQPDREPARGETNTFTGEAASRCRGVHVEAATRNARRLASEGSPRGCSRATVLAGGVQVRPLASYSGAVSIADITTTADGRVVRDLFLRHTGVVDINACMRGELSSGKLEWGGNLFTNAAPQSHAKSTSPNSTATATASSSGPNSSRISRRGISRRGRGCRAARSGKSPRRTGWPFRSFRDLRDFEVIRCSDSSRLCCWASCS